MARKKTKKKDSGKTSKRSNVRRMIPNTELAALAEEVRKAGPETMEACLAIIEEEIRRRKARSRR